MSEVELSLIEGEVRNCPNVGTTCWFRPNPIGFGKGTVKRRWSDGDNIYVEVPEWSASVKYSLDKIVWED